MIEKLKTVDVEISDSQIILREKGQSYIFDFSTTSKRLAHSSTLERSIWKRSASGYGIHWPLIDEDISIKALLVW